MIPKIIHYCWFGKKRQSALIKKCISSWKTHLSEYQIMCWNEKNLPLNHPFINEAIKKKKYAFAADVTRLYVLKEFGGIYLDTDMLVIESLDDFLSYQLFVGEEVKSRINLAIVGASPQHPIIKHFFSYYDTLTFDIHNPPVISFTLTKLLYESSFDDKSYKVLSSDYFYPMPYECRDENYRNYLTEKSYTVHLWNHSWRNAHDYILEQKYFTAIRKILEHLLFHKADRLNIDYYRGLYHKFKKSIDRHLPHSQ